MIIMKEKLVSIGIKSPLELHEIIKGHIDLSYKIWRGEAKLTIKRANKIKEKLHISLDWLFSED